MRPQGGRRGERRGGKAKEGDPTGAGRGEVKGGRAEQGAGRGRAGTTKMRKVCAKKDRREGMSGMRNVGVEYVEWARREKEKEGQENQERGIRGREDQGDAREPGRRVRGEGEARLVGEYGYQK